MNKKLLAMLFSISLILGNFAFIATVLALQPPVTSATFWVGTIGQPNRLDPADCYDTASAEVLMNVYDTLIDFDRNQGLNRTEQGLIDEFIPGIAMSWYREDVVLLLQNLTVVNQTDPTCSYWTNGTDTFHINNFKDNYADGTLGPSDVVYIEVYNGDTGAPYDPWDWEPCTKFTYQVRNKTHVDSTVHLNVTRRVYYFEINTTIMTHPYQDYDNNLVASRAITTEDVEYSFERGLVQDRYYGPMWMFFKPMFDEMNQDWWWGKDGGLIELGKLIDCAVQRNSTHVWISVGIDFPETAWYQILAQSWGSIVPKDFAIDHACWNGTFFNATNYPIYKYWHRWPTISRSPLSTPPTVSSPIPEEAEPWEHLYDPAPTCRGTGAYQFNYWHKATLEWRADKFPGYWKGWGPTEPGGGHVDTVIVTGIAEWSTRKMMFLKGDFDAIAVPRAYMWDLLPDPNDPYTPLPGLKLFYGYPTISSDSLHYQFHVYPSPYVPKIGGVEKPDFFGNVHMRRAFSYALNFTKYIEEAWFNEATQVATWHIPTLKPDYRDPSIVAYDLNLTKVEDELKAAEFGGTSVWESGFSIDLFYNEGNDQRRIACEMIESAIESLNAMRIGKDPFVIEVGSMDWDSYLDALYGGTIGIWLIGWLADFLDCDNWARPYMHTYGDFSYMQGYSNTDADELIDLAVKTPDGPNDGTGRSGMYWELQHIFIDDCPTLMIVNALGRAWMRDWVQGWYYNQLYPGTPFYDRWKAQTAEPKPVDLDITSTITNIAGLQVRGVDVRTWPEALINISATCTDFGETVTFYAEISAIRTDMEDYLVAIDTEIVLYVKITYPTQYAEIYWNETACPYGFYNITGEVYPFSSFAYDSNTLNNEIQSPGMAEVLPPGEVLGGFEVASWAWVVDGSDLVYIIEHVPSYVGQPWFVYVSDLNHDSVCDGADYVICLEFIPTVYEFP